MNRDGTENIHQSLIGVFDGLFRASHETVLRGGYEEPLYLPAAAGKPAEIRFSHDYPSSALHEIAHWCIAGTARRQLVDYGYWYSPDGRNAVEQAAFYGVEVKPQALEWVFSLAVGIKFRVSADNLCGDDAGLASFTEKVRRQRSIYLERGLPLRAERFLAALRTRFRKIGPASHTNDIRRATGPTRE